MFEVGMKVRCNAKYGAEYMRGAIGVIQIEREEGMSFYLVKFPGRNGGIGVNGEDYLMYEEELDAV